MNKQYLQDNFDHFNEPKAFIKLAIALVDELKNHVNTYKKPLGHFDARMIQIKNVNDDLTVSIIKSQKNNTENNVQSQFENNSMHSEIDYRPDIYLLGQLLYEIITKQPFNDQNDLIVLFKDYPEIPDTIQLLLQKLLFSHQNDRYQTYDGILFDLKKCRSQLEMKNNIEFFLPGEKDKRKHLIFENYLYGRETEKNTLLNMYKQVENNRPQFLFVSGYSGVGKTALISQFLKSTVKNSFFISGKYDQYSKTPNQALIEAFNDLTNQLLSNESGRDLWATKIIEYLGPNASVLTTFIPNLERLIGPQKDYQSSTSKGEADRIAMSIKQFIKCIGQTQPLIIFLDDLHRATKNEIEFIKLLITDINVKLFFIGAFRSNELHENSALITLIEYIQTNSNNVDCKLNLDDLSLKYTEKTLQNLLNNPSSKNNHLYLDGLTTTTIKDQLNDVLQISSNEDITELAKVIHKKTHGNPLYIRQLLVFMEEKKHLWFNSSQLKWEWNLDKINTLSISENVLSLLATKISELPTETQTIIKYAACLGTTFEIKDLETISGIPASHILLYLWHAENQHLIVSIKEHPKISNERFFKNQTFRFVHDKLQETAHSLIPKTEINQFMWDIGFRLYKDHKKNAKKFNQRLFWITNALNMGIGVSPNQSNVNLIIQLNLKSAEKARLNLAFKTARNYLKTAQFYIEKNPSKPPKIHQFDCYKQLLEVEFHCQNTNEMNQLFSHIKSKSKFNLIEKFEIYTIYVKLLSSLNQQNYAVRIGIEGLRMIGIKCSQTPSLFNILKDHYYFKVIYKKLAQQKRIEEKNHLMVLQIKMFTELAIIAHTTDEPKLLIHMIFKIMHVSLKSSCDYLIAHAYVAYGLILITKFNDHKRGMFFGKLAVNLVASSTYLDIITKVRHINASFIMPWHQPYKECSHELKATYKLANQSADYYFAGFADANNRMLTFSLEPLKLKDTFEEGFIMNPIMKEFYNIRRFYLYFLIEKQPNSFKTILRKKSGDDDSKSIHIYYENFLQRFLSMLFGFYDEGYNNSINMNTKVMGNMLAMQICDNFLCNAIICSRNFKKGSLLKKTNCLKHLVVSLSKLNQWQKVYNQNFRHRYLFIKALLFETIGLNRLALSHYKNAVKELDKSNILMDFGIFYEYIAHFFYKLNNINEAKHYLQKSLDSYSKWGAHAKVEHLKQTFIIH